MPGVAVEEGFVSLGPKVVLAPGAELREDWSLEADMVIGMFFEVVNLWWSVCEVKNGSYCSWRIVQLESIAVDSSSS
jgi:hypothetical protein